MGTRQYVGARYVPKVFADEHGDSQWRDNIPYEALTIVTNLGNSYTSRKPVPVGVQIDNAEYWALTGAYNQQIEEFRKIAEECKEAAENIENVFITPEMFGAKGDNVTDDTESFNNALIFAKENGIKKVICKSKYYKIGSTIILPKDMHVNFDFDGNGAQLFYSGNNWCIKCESNFSDGWATRYHIHDLRIFGTPNGIGGIKTNTVCWYEFKNIDVSEFINGCGFQLYTLENGWTEENIYSRCRAIKCKIGFQTFIDPSGTYDGIDGSLSGNAISVNHNIWEYCTFNGKTNNSIGFDMHGNFSRCLWLSSGGWLNEDGSSNCLMYQFNGVSYGAKLSFPWVDSGYTPENCIKLVNPSSVIPFNDQLTLIGIGHSSFTVPSEYYQYLNIVDDNTIGGHLTNHLGLSIFMNDFYIKPFDNGLCIISDVIRSAASETGESYTLNLSNQIKIKHLVCANVIPVLNDAYWSGQYKASPILSINTDTDGFITSITFSIIGPAVEMNYNISIIGTKY